MVVYAGPRREWTGRVFCRKTASLAVLFLFSAVRLPARSSSSPPRIRPPVGPRSERPVYRSSGPRGHDGPAARLPALPATRSVFSPLSALRARSHDDVPSPHLHCRLPPTSHMVQAASHARSRHRCSMRASAASISVRSARVRQCSPSTHRIALATSSFLPTGANLNQSSFRPCICLIPHLIPTSYR